LAKKVAILEARVAELNDKLSKLCITEEEWKAYQKVNSVLAGTAGLPPSAHERCPVIIVPLDRHGNCGWCSYVWLASCAVPSCGKGDGGTKSGPDFSGLGGSS
jgi:hypothetical protein